MNGRTRERVRPFALAPRVPAANWRSSGTVHTSFLPPLLFLSMTAAAAAQVDVVDYDVALDVELATRTIRGVATLRVDVPTDASTLHLDAVELSIASVRVDDVPAEHRTEGYGLAIELTPATRRNRSVTIAYTARPTRGMSFDPNQAYAAFHTPRWLPCVFDPGDKATLTLRLSLDTALQSVAPGLRVDGREFPIDTQHVWRMAQPHASYLFGFAVGSFTVASDTVADVALHYLCDGLDADALDEIFRSTPDALRFFMERAGVPFPYASYTQALVRGGVAQELPGFALIRARYGLEVAGEAREDWLIAHELAHQWWGNAITCRDWSHFWLNEGMAVFMTAAYKQVRWGDDEYAREIVLARLGYERARAAGAERPLHFTAWTTAETAGGSIAYQKGALVLHAIRSAIGDDAFWRAIRTYTARHLFGSVEGGDLLRALEEESDQPIDSLFSMLVETDSLPTIVATHRVDGDRVHVRLRSSRPMPMQLLVEVASGPQRVVRAITLGRGDDSVSVEIADTAGLVVHADADGRYPLRIAHEREPAMLLRSIAQGRSVHARVDAMLELRAIAADSTHPLRAEVRAGLDERSRLDSARIVRAIAGRILTE